MSTPIAPNGQLDFHYIVTGYEHVCQVRAEIVDPTATPPNVYLETVGGGSRLWTTCADEFLLIMKTFYNTTVTFPQVVLQHYVAGAYVEIDTYATAVAGTSASVSQLAQQNTMTWKDQLNDLIKLVFLEGFHVPPTHNPLSASGAPFTTLNTSMLTKTATNLGFWVQGRSGYPANRGLFRTLGYNKKLLRKRGLA